jgi:hypothetical protein
VCSCVQEEAEAHRQLEQVMSEVRALVELRGSCFHCVESKLRVQQCMQGYASAALASHWLCASSQSDDWKELAMLQQRMQAR